MAQTEPKMCARALCTSCNHVTSDCKISRFTVTQRIIGIVHHPVSINKRSRASYCQAIEPSYQ